MSISIKPRVWLVAGLGTAAAPSDQPIVRDDLLHVWHPAGTAATTPRTVGITPAGPSYTSGSTSLR